MLLLLSASLPSQLMITTALRPVFYCICVNNVATVVAEKLNGQKGECTTITSWPWVWHSNHYWQLLGRIANPYNHSDPVYPVKVATINKKRDWSSPRSEAKASGWWQSAVLFMFRAFMLQKFYVHRRVWYISGFHCTIYMLYTYLTFGHHPHP